MPLKVWHRGILIGEVNTIKELIKILNEYNPVIVTFPGSLIGIEVTKKNIETPEVQEFLKRNLRSSRHRVKR